MILAINKPLCTKYIVLYLLTLTPIIATQSVTTSLIIASTLALSPTKATQNFSKSRSLALHKAVEKRDYAAVENLINNPKTDVNAKADYHIDIHKQYTIYGNTPLIMCCNHGDNKSLQIVKLLLGRKDINVNLGNKWGETPLIMCCVSGDNKSLQIAEALLGHDNINVNLGDKYGDTPLDTIILFMIENKATYTYVNLWNLLVAKGGILNKRKKEYEKLNPNHFAEPQKTCIRLIKQNPPKHFNNNQPIDSQN